MKKQIRAKFHLWKRILFFFLFFWTGILFLGVVRRYHLTGNLEQELINVLIKKNYMNIGALLAVHSNTDLITSQLLKNSSEVMRYTADLSGEKEDEEETDGKGKRLFLTDNTITNKEKQEKGYFEKADELLNDTKQSEAVPVSEIFLFDNGSADITSKNSSGVEMERDSIEKISDDSKEALEENEKKIKKLFQGYSRSYLLKNFFITDSSTSIDNKVFQVKKLLTMDLTLKQEKKPQILIIHTHGASESFKHSKNGKEDSIIGVGTKLAAILSEQYGYQVIHDKTEYDRIGGQIDRNKAYNQSLAGAQKILKKYPSIEIVIDLHRDGVGNRVKRTTIVDGKKTAQVMFFNGLSRSSSGDIAYLKNPNLQGNLAFSLQLKLACMRHFKDFAKAVYLKGYRYNMHLKKRYTLIELGNENNTVAEAKNAAAPLALVIHEVLSGTGE